MKRILIVLILVFTLCGCSSNNNNYEVLDYKEILKENNYIIIDVRTNEEYKESHVKGSINIPYNEINKDSDIPKDKTIMVYCRSGARSKIAYNTLKDLGYNVYDLGSFENIDLEKE